MYHGIVAKILLPTVLWEMLTGKGTKGVGSMAISLSWKHVLSLESCGESVVVEHGSAA